MIPFIDLLTLIAAVTGLSAKPGPGMVMFVSRSLKDGMKPAYALFFGSLAAELIYFTVAILTVRLAEEAVFLMSFAFKLLGAAYLGYLGVKGLMNLNRQTEVLPEKMEEAIEEGRPRSDVSLHTDLIAGLMLGLGNPLIIGFYAALLPAVLNLQTLGLSEFLICFTAISAVHIVVGSIQIVGADMVRGFLSTPKALRMIDLTASITMCIVAAYIGWSGLTELFAKATAG